MNRNSPRSGGRPDPSLAASRPGVLPLVPLQLRRKMARAGTGVPTDGIDESARMTIPTYRSPSSLKARGSVTSPLLVALVTACAPLSQSVQSIGGANPEAVGSVARLAVDTTHPVLLRAVDGTFLTSVQVSSALRSYAYVLHAGPHVLWVSSAPYGLPLVPQRIKCYVLDVRLSPGASYTLRFDVPTQVPVLARAASPEPEAVGVLVDEPLVFERACRWR